MKNKLILNPKTAQQLDVFLANPSHALLISGQSGSGKTYLARHIAAELLNVEAEKLDNHPYFLIIEKPEDKQNIPIESIRTAVNALKLKIAGTAGVKRVVLIRSAQLMTPEAQNALLKSLEEPPAGTVFILTVPSERALLPTIASRTTKLPVRPISLEVASEQFSDYPAEQVKSAWNLSQGAVGLMNALLGEEAHPLKASIEQAKAFLSKDRYQRLIALDKLGKDELDSFLLALAKVLQALYKNTAKSGSAAQTARLARSAKLVLDSRQDLAENAIPKLVVLRLALKLNV